MGAFSFADIVHIALRAGKEILKVYQEDFKVEVKNDHSPLTEADKIAHQTIMTGLTAIDRSIPILSEEGRSIPYEERKHWDRFWLVDPLDGTKEFIKKNGEFTVNIAMISGKYPAFGVIYAPVLDICYFGGLEKGAYKLEQASKVAVKTEEELLQKSVRLPEKSERNDLIRVVASRSHLSAETKAFIDELKMKHRKVETVSVGSSLKFCLVAEGQADYYPRFAPTMEWDTAAGQAIVEGALGQVVRHEDEQRFFYNRDNLKNGWFLATRKNN